ncbi:MAG TPA: arginine repressor [Ruminococcaceae bacterium]|nr:arginine repressor [Oscillospiraceae bacterium]HBG55558.1 arginine repressor [Oscillospiraceae bacterium]HBT91772.1 arginine repressor [Oscillospiraceae bacterium]HCB90976.1 arginine repressor [Oscillospiraceae bacterium]
MKKKRHERILELISRYSIDTQEELLHRLQESGFRVTQATVSRDIKELRLVKVLSPDGKYRYMRAEEKARQNDVKFSSLFQDSAVAVDYAQNIVAVKCLTGMANAVCAAMDTLHWDDAVATLSGDDTIFILMRNEGAAGRLAGKLKDMMR